MAKVYFTDGTIKDITPKNNIDFKLEELKEYIEGFLEVIYLKDTENIMIIDEEGKIKDLPFNKEATIIAMKNNSIYPNDYITGNAIVCKFEEFK